LKSNYLDRIKNLCILNIMFSITLIMLNNILPIVNINENSNQINYNLFSMQNCQNLELLSISSNLEIFNLFLLIIIALSIICLIGVIINPIKKYNEKSLILILLAYPLILLNAFLFIKYIILSLDIINNEIISLTYIIDPFRYSYITIIFFFLLLTISISLFIMLTKILILFINERKKLKKIKNELKIKEKDEVSKKVFFDEDIVIRNKEEKKIEEENLKDDEVEIKEKDIEVFSDDKDIKEVKFWENKDKIEMDKNVQDEQLINNQELSDDKKSPNKIFVDKDNKEQSQDEIQESKKISFENALDQAIKKRKDNRVEINNQKDLTKLKEELEEKEEENKNIMQLKCPKCNNIFSVSLEKGKNEIICPNCKTKGYVEY